VSSSVRGGFSLKLFSEFLKQKSPSLFLFKIEDESFISLLTRYKFNHYILPESQEEYIYIINKKKIGFVFSEFVAIRRTTASKEIKEICKKSAAMLYAYLFQKRLDEGTAAKKAGYVSSVCTACDDSFSRLWDPVLNGCDVSISRDTATLNWLYFSSSRFRKRVVIQCRRTNGNSLAGYLVFDVQRLKETDDATLQLMDMCIGDNDPLVLDSLVSCAIEAGKQNGAPLLVMWGNNEHTESYFRTTFSMRKTARHHRFMRFSDDPKSSPGRINDKMCISMIHPPQ
jgi:hypothetical protein